MCSKSNPQQSYVKMVLNFISGNIAIKSSIYLKKDVLKNFQKVTNQTLKINFPNTFANISFFCQLTKEDIRNHC